jgi:hypothetical protein
MINMISFVILYEGCRLATNNAKHHFFCVFVVKMKERGIKLPGRVPLSSERMDLLHLPL